MLGVHRGLSTCTLQAFHLKNATHPLAAHITQAQILLVTLSKATTLLLQHINRMNMPTTNTKAQHEKCMQYLADATRAEDHKSKQGLTKACYLHKSNLDG